MVKEHEDPEFLRWFEELDRATFHMCMHKGSRTKNTRLLATPGMYTTLMAPCDGQHRNNQNHHVRPLRHPLPGAFLEHHVNQVPPLVPEFSTFLELTQEPKQPSYKCLASHVTGENTESQQQQDQEQQSRGPAGATRLFESGHKD